MNPVDKCVRACVILKAAAGEDTRNSRTNHVAQDDVLPHLKPVCLGIHVADVDSSFVAEQELFTLPVGVDAHIVLVTLFVGNERLHDEGVEDACHNFHL